MLRIQSNCSLVLLGVFIASMFGSSSHADLNAAYALSLYYMLIARKKNQSSNEVIGICLVVSMVMIGFDLWSMSLVEWQGVGELRKLFKYFWIAVEILLKILLVIGLLMWRIGGAKQKYESVARV